MNSGVGQCQWQVGKGLQGKCWRPGVNVQVFDDKEEKDEQGNWLQRRRALCKEHTEELKMIQERNAKNEERRTT